MTGGLEKFESESQIFEALICQAPKQEACI